MHYQIKSLYGLVISFLKRGHRFTLKQLIRNQYLTRKEIEALNWQKRKKIVEYAYENVPFYTKQYNGVGFHPNQLKAPEDFIKVPILRRDEIKNAIEEMISIKADKNQLFLTGTGGTTGEPVMVYKQRKDNGLGSALQARMLQWWDIHPLSDYATAYRIVDKQQKDNNEDSQTDLAANVKSIMRFINSYIHQKIQKRISIDPALMNDELMELFIQNILNDQPIYLVGYVGAIDEIARYLLTDVRQL